MIAEGRYMTPFRLSYKGKGGDILGLLSWLTSKLDLAPLSGKEIDKLLVEYNGQIGDLYIRELAFHSAVNLIANAVSKCEFKTFEKGREKKGQEFYLWNIEPNRNQNSSGFLHKLIATLYRNNECLVIGQGDQLLVADKFIRRPYVLYEDIFEQVTVGDFTFNKTFSQSEVLFFRLAEKDTRKIVNGFYDSYAKLIGNTMKAYNQNLFRKGVFAYDTLPVAGTDQRKNFDALVNESIRKWQNAEGPAALPLGKGQSWVEDKQKTYSSENTRDIRAMIDDVSDYTAKALGIPPALLRGDVQGVSDALVQFLTFCLDPLLDMIQEEINRKRYGYAGFSKGNFLQIDSKAVKHVDLLSVSTSVDKLISSGAFTINDIRKLCGEQPVDELWAEKHFITKNFNTIEEALKAADEKIEKSP